MDILISEEKGVRMLHFGSDWVQGAMRIARPYALELEYTREMMVPLLFHPERHWPRSALLIGLGVGALPKFLHRHRPECRITVVEISPAVVGAAQMHFKLPEQSPQFNVDIGCGADFISSSTRTFDLIMVDGFDGKAKVGPLNSTAFYLGCKSRLTRGGLLVANLLSNQKDSEPNKKRFSEAFDGKALILSPCASGNVIAMGNNADQWPCGKNELAAHAAQLKEETGLNMASTVSKLQSILDA